MKIKIKKWFEKNWDKVFGAMCIWLSGFSIASLSFLIGGLTLIVGILLLYIKKILKL